MIIKSYELKKLDLDKNKYILFYGINNGAKIEEIKRLSLLNKDKAITNYDEKQILENSNNIYNTIFSKSLFEDKKIIIINRASDKIVKIIEDFIEKNIIDISIIFNADNLEKRSKLRSLFEKNKNLICSAFYADTPEILARIAHNFFKEKRISISQANINLIVSKCNGDRGILRNELTKIELFAQNQKVSDVHHCEAGATYQNTSIVSWDMNSPLEFRYEESGLATSGQEFTQAFSYQIT